VVIKLYIQNNNFYPKFKFPYNYRHFNQLPNFSTYHKDNQNDNTENENKPPVNILKKNSLIDLINSSSLEDLLIIGLIYFLIKNDLNSNFMLIAVLFLILLEK